MIGCGLAGSGLWLGYVELLRRIGIERRIGGYSECRGFPRSCGGAEAYALVVDGKRTIHAFMDLDPCPRVACPAL